MITSKSTQATEPKPLTVIKLGGSLLDQLTADFYVGLLALKNSGHSIVIVHGGGPAINQQLADQNIETPIKDGLRVTSEEAVKIVQSTLVGLVNPSIVHRLNSVGIQAIGLNGFDDHLLLCDYLDPDVYQCVGKIRAVKPELLNVLTGNDYVPVLSCIGTTEDGQALNINADTVAGKVAYALQADELLLVTDTPGIKINDETQHHSSPDQIASWIESGDIYGGMIPKVQAALECIEAGVVSVKIVGESLQGTTISREAAIN